MKEYVNVQSILKLCNSLVKGTERVPILLVGNKVDLEHQREVPTVEGMALAQIWGCAFVEASAKQRTNVNEVFAEIVREMNLKHSTKDREIVCECCCISQCLENHIIAKNAQNIR